MIIKRGESERPVCVFGKLYCDAREALDILRKVCVITTEGDSIKVWTSGKKHQYNVFYVTKEFYEEMKNTPGCITRDMYNTWISFRNA